MDVDAYLRRIDYAGPREPDAATLRALHAAHLLAVPFENLSIHRREPIVLSDAALFEKIVTGRRGGFCYELNGLFAALLRALGYDVSMLSAGVMGASGEFGPEFDHMVLLVALEAPWLVDVGFGDSFREPLRFDDRGEQRQGRETYRIGADASGDRWIVTRTPEAGEARALVRFSTSPHVYEDYAGMCAFHQTSPESPFTQQRLCTRATPGGRLTLSGMRLVTSHGGARDERILADEREYTHVLRESFGIVLDRRP